MRYLPKSPPSATKCCRQIGVGSIDDLFATIPAEYRLERDLDVPRQHGRVGDRRHFARCVAERRRLHQLPRRRRLSPLRPVIIDSLVQRGEFLTSYTPYQAEITQGTLQAIFEFQTMICELTGMEIANASMYDGSTGAAEAVMMAVRITGAAAFWSPEPCIPEYREVMQTYAQHQGLPGDGRRIGDDGRLDLAALEPRVTDETACVLVQSPNFFGVIEDIPAIAEIAHTKGALLIVSIAEAISLGVVRPPVEADIVSMEAQSFGVALSYGGPYCGVIAAQGKVSCGRCRAACRRDQGQEGRRGFVLTLSTREQHIRREKATSNICTNQALVALMATIFLTVYGKEGIRELALHNLAKATMPLNVFSKLAEPSCSSPPLHAFMSLCSRPPNLPSSSTNNCSSRRSSVGCPWAAGTPNWATPPCGARPSSTPGSRLTTRLRCSSLDAEEALITRA